MGSVGLIVPGLPGTVFFIFAAWCFSHSNERLEQWVLDLPAVGPMVADYRAGRGMPMKAKVMAISCIIAAVTFSAGFRIEAPSIRVVVALAGLIGVWFIAWRVPTKVEPVSVDS